MTRSFVDRVLGGVCGGMSVQFKGSAWLYRTLFAVLGVVSGGAFAVLYVMLWWVLPQQSPMDTRRRAGSGTFVFLILTIATIALVIGRISGLTLSSGGADLFWPINGVLLAGVFFLRQVRG